MPGMTHIGPRLSTDPGHGIVLVSDVHPPSERLSRRRTICRPIRVGDNKKRCEEVFVLTTEFVRFMLC
ncbi:MAG: hypothetical protein QG577_1617 [Thermodesulfobacteriota bacterium]|nr:hypothetical protein [Thermodesulfobacteriota bacterium]